MRLDLTHSWDVPLRDLVVIFHIVLKRLIVVILHLFTRYATDLRILVRLVISLGHGDLVLRVQGQL